MTEGPVPKTPVDSQMVEWNEFLVNLARHAPVSPVDFKITGIPGDRSLVGALQSRFPGFIETDQTGFLRLAADARPNVVKAVIGVVESANDNLERGWERQEQESYEPKRETFRVSKGQLEAVSERLAAVEYESPDVNNFLEQARTLVNQASLQAMRVETKADLVKAKKLKLVGDCRRTAPPDAVKVYHAKAVNVLTNARDCVFQCQSLDGRGDGGWLSVSAIDNLIETLGKNIESTESNAPEEYPSSTDVRASDLDLQNISDTSKWVSYDELTANNGDADLSLGQPAATATNMETKCQLSKRISREMAETKTLPRHASLAL